MLSQTETIFYSNDWSVLMKSMWRLPVLSSSMDPKPWLSFS